MSFPICETIDDYEPTVDVENQCLRDLNLSEIKIKYGQRAFRCCDVEYNPNKRYQFMNSHITTRKHKKFIAIENEKHKQTYGTFTDPNEMFTTMRKEIRDLKTRLYHKNEESKFKDQEIEKLQSINTKMHENLQGCKQKRGKKLTIVPIENLIDI